MSTSITYAVALAKVKALGEGTVFYASDIGALGGTMNGLHLNGFIEKTGKKKFYMVEIEPGYYIEASVCEWRVHDTKSQYTWREQEINDLLTHLASAVDALKKLGY